MFDPANFGKLLVVIGLGLAVAGGVLWGLSRLGLPLGQLPGDLRFERGNFSVYIPLATSILLSLGLTILLNLIMRFWK